MAIRGQAALEFLTTYGWAFLVILIMMSALAYFGVLNPSKLLPDRCNFGAEISCNKNTMVVANKADNTLIMRLSNNFGVGVVVTNARVTTDVPSVGACTPQINGAAINAFPWGSDITITFNADCNDPDAGLCGDKMVPKEKIKFNIEIDYYPASAGLSYAKIIFGEIFTTVQQAP